jgi:hypothetical protein
MEDKYILNLMGNSLDWWLFGGLKGGRNIRLKCILEKFMRM